MHLRVGGVQMYSPLQRRQRGFKLTGLHVRPAAICPSFRRFGHEGTKSIEIFGRQIYLSGFAEELRSAYHILGIIRTKPDAFKKGVCRLREPAESGECPTQFSVQKRVVRKGEERPLGFAECFFNSSSLEQGQGVTSPRLRVAGIN